MPGTILKYAAALSLSAFLAACGGDDSSSPLAGDGSSSGGNGGGTGDTGGSGEQTTMALGTGENDSFVEGQINTELSKLAPRASTSLSVSVVNAANGNTPVTGQDVEVTFRSGCVTEGTATIDSPVVTGSGVAETTYTAEGCAPNDTVTASVEGQGATASVVLNIDSSTADRIISNGPEFTSIAPEGAGSSSRASESLVTFTVVDEAGDPVPNAKVNFELSGDTPAATTPVTLKPSEETSGSNGEVSTLVIAGSESTVVRVVAKLDSGSGTQSAPIAINSTIPVESGVTLAADNFLPDAQFTAGVEVGFTVFATDNAGQNVRGNTIVNFTTDGGSITPDCTLDDTGKCSVVWRSQAPWFNEPEITAETIGELTSGGVGTIAEKASLLISSSRDPQVTLSSSGSNQYCATSSVLAGDGSRIHPPTDTTIEFSVTDTGEILSAESSQTVTGNFVPQDTSQNETCILASGSGNLTVTVTTPGGKIAEDITSL